MSHEQLDLFGVFKENYRMTKPLRLIEFFGGIGSQARACEVLNIPFEHHRLVEWAHPSIIAYNAIHIHDWSDHTEGMSFEEVLDKTEGISADYNKPMTREQRAKKGEAWCRKILSSMIACHDYCPDVSKVHWNDLGIVERERYTYGLTYSFPCTDLSNAGKLAGYSRGSGTRSGLLWEVERVLLECQEHDCLPDWLLMENVKGVMSDKVSWADWQHSLTKMGYANFVKVLNAKDYGIPQNRERCFMVSIRGDYAYDFPRPYKREFNLKGFLDKEVDERFYLSQEHLDRITAWNSYQNPLDSVMGRKTETSPTITTRVAESLDGGVNASTKLFSDDIEDTTNLKNDRGGGLMIPIRDATSLGYRIAREGDGVDISLRSNHRGTVQDGMCHTIKTSIDVGVLDGEDR